MVPISKLPLLAAPTGSRSDAGTFIVSDNVNVSSDVNPTTNSVENGWWWSGRSLSCLENEIIEEDNSSNVDSVLELDNDKT